MTELVLISCFNFHCIELALNFLESLRKLDIDKKHISFVTDIESYDKLKSLNYNVELLSDTKEFKFSFEFDSDDFKALSYLRYKIISAMLKKYSYVWYFDVDTVVVNNVIKYFESLPKDFDVCFQMDMDSYCTGCILLKSTPKVRGFVNNFYATKNIKFNDQVWMHRCFVLKQHIYNVLKIIELYRFSFINGDIYFNNALNEDFKKSMEPIYFIHANYMVGNETKIKALKDKGLWFI